jgi:hypothetical protein
LTPLIQQAILNRGIAARPLLAEEHPVNHSNVIFRPLRRGQCRACKTTDAATPWTDHTRTHCQRCHCATCGRKFLSSSEYNIDAENGVKVCRASKRCAEEAAKQASGKLRREAGL